jgi:hypothetical protein
VLLGLWQEGEPDWLPWGVPHRFAVYDPTTDDYLIVKRHEAEGDPVAAGGSYGYAINGGPAYWRPEWVWVYLPPVPETR